jgi:hypothetical protein
VQRLGRARQTARPSRPRARRRDRSPADPRQGRAGRLPAGPRRRGPARDDPPIGSRPRASSRRRGAAAAAPPACPGGLGDWREGPGSARPSWLARAGLRVGSSGPGGKAGPGPGPAWTGSGGLSRVRSLSSCRKPARGRAFRARRPAGPARVPSGPRPGPGSADRVGATDFQPPRRGPETATPRGGSSSPSLPGGLVRPVRGHRFGSGGPFRGPGPGYESAGAGPSGPQRKRGAGAGSSGA